MRNAVVAPFGALMILGLLVAGCTAKAQQTPAAAPPAAVTTAEVLVRDLRPWDEFTGRLEAVDTVQVRPRVGGYIDRVAFREGAVVHKGELLFQIDPRPYQAEVNRLTAEVAAARAKLELSAVNRERGERLVAQQALARSEYDRLVSEEKAAQAALGAAQAALDAARLNLSFTHITAPITGRVSKAMITPGNLVTSSDELTTIVSDSPIYATFSADEQSYLKYAAARSQPGPVFLGLMTEDGYPHQGRLVFVDNALDAHSGTITGRAIFDNPDGRFTPGLFARIRLVGSQAEPVALVPDRAIAADLGKRFVLVVGPDKMARYQPVTVGPRVGDLRIVRDGLKAGDVVIVSGGQRVKPGDHVAPTRIALSVPKDLLAQLDPDAQPAPVRLARAETGAGVN